MSKTALLAAIRDLDLLRARNILDARPDLIDARERDDRDLVQLACCIPPEMVGVSDAAQMRLVSYLLDTDTFEIDRTVGKDKCTALFFAVSRARNASLMKLLMSRGAKPANAPGGGLFAAVWWDDVPHIGLLLDAGADIDPVVGVTPFVAAIDWKKDRSAKYLVQRGANVNFQDRKGRTALHHIIERALDPALLTWMIEHGASPDIPDKAGVTARGRASRKREKRYIRAIEAARTR